MDKVQKDDLIDIKGLLISYIKHWYWFVISIIICLGGAFVYLKVTAPVYEIKSNILVKEDDSKGGGGIQSALMKNIGFGMGKSNAEDELEIVGSHSLMRMAVKKKDLNKTYIQKRLIRNLDCYKNTPIEVVALESVQDTLSIFIEFNVKVKKDGTVSIKAYDGFKKLGSVEASGFPVVLKTNYGDYTFNKTSYFKAGKNYKMDIYLSGYDLCAESMREAVSMGLLSKKGNVIALSIYDVNIARGKDVLNTLIALFNEDGINDKNIVAENTAKFLEERLNIISSDLSSVERDVENYKKLNELTDIPTEAKIILEKNGDFKEKLIDIETQYAIVGLIQDYVNSPQNKYALIPSSLGLNDRAVVEAIQAYNDLLLERVRLVRSTNPTNPTLLNLNEQVDVMRENLKMSIASVKAGIDITQKDLKNQEKLFMDRIKGMPTQEREFLDIKRQQVIKEQLFIFLLEKKEENSLTLAVTAPKAKVIDPAYNINKPLKPQKPLIAIFALVLGFVIPVIVLYIKGLLRTKFADKNELEKLTEIPVLGEICVSHSKDVVVVKEGDTSSIVELFRLIRTNIQFVLNGRDDKVILVTSSVSGEGKSFFTCNFAQSLALMNKKVVMVGLDIRSPRLMDYLHLPNNQLGITNYLASEKYSPKDIILSYHEDLNNHLDVIPAGPVPPNPGELLISERLDALFAYLREHYDYIVIDSAPVGMVSDSFTLNRVCDATIYVCRANYTEKDNIRYVNNLVENKRLKKVSLVINGTTARQGYGYGYGGKHNRKK